MGARNLLRIVHRDALSLLTTAQHQGPDFTMVHVSMEMAKLICLCRLLGGFDINKVMPSAEMLATAAMKDYTNPSTAQEDADIVEMMSQSLQVHEAMLQHFLKEG